MPELSWKHFEGNLAAATTAFDRIWELENKSNSRMHIIVLRQGVSGNAVAPGESATIHASKRNTLAGIVNDDEEFNQQASGIAGPTGATPVDGGIVINDRERYLEGEVVIEAGKSLYGHAAKFADPVLVNFADIGYFLEK